MDFREYRRWIAVAVALTATVPVLAILCRGHTPSRFDIPNLPAWERTPLPAAAPAIKPAEIPLEPRNLTVATCPAIWDLLAMNEDQLFRQVERPGAIVSGNARDITPGEWLEEAAIFAANHSQLAQRLSAACIRLLNDQAQDGYIGPKKPSAKVVGTHHAFHTQYRFATSEIAAHARNTMGLLAAFPIMDNPAVQYSAIRAGHFILENYDRHNAGKSAKDRDAIVYALARLYLSTSDRDFLDAACRNEVGGETSGVTLCMLYQATGNSEYLTRAKSRWAGGDHSPRLAASLFSLTGAPGYLENCRDADRGPWMYPVAVTRSRSGISVNRLLAVKATAGSFSLTLQPGIDESAIVISKAPRTPAEIRALPLYQTVHVASPHPAANDAKADEHSSASFWSKSRRWQPGDKIMVSHVKLTDEDTFILRPSGAGKPTIQPALAGHSHHDHGAQPSHDTAQTPLPPRS